jgi:putative transcriptional regulator
MSPMLDANDETIVAEIGARLREVRLQRNLSQAQLAREAGVGQATLQRLEEGRSANLTTLVRVLRALGLGDGLERLVPRPAPSPLDQLERRGKARQRASGSSRATGSSGPSWRWGDEAEPEP